MVNLSDYIGDAPRAEPEPSTLERTVSLLDVAVKSAAYSAIQQPMDGLFQLAGAKSPKLVEDGKRYEFDTPEWYASTIGHGAGFMVPYLATSKLTALTGMKAGVGKAVFDGALTGFTMTPTAEGQDGLTSRSLAAFSSSVMFGSQHLLAGHLANRMVAEAATAPILTRLAINTASGMGAGITSLEASSLIQGNGFVTDRQALAETAVAAAATGVALDAFNIGAARMAGTRAGQKASGPQLEADAKTNSRSTSELPARAAETGDGTTRSTTLPARAAEKGDGTARSTTLPARAAETEDGTTRSTSLAADSYRQIGEWTDPKDGVAGAKQYVTGRGEKFWQIPDGRIYYEQGDPENPVFKTWSPFGTGDPATFLGPEGRMGRQVWTRHEPQGFFFNHEGIQHNSELYNIYRDATVTAKPELSPKLANELALSVPLNIELDMFSLARVVRTADGAMYEPATIELRVPKSGKPPNGLTMTDYINNWTEAKTLAARRYSILNGEGTNATAVVVPEHYAAQLDEVRSLREIATQNPSHSPELREDILRARRDLFASGFADRLLPEHWGQFIDILPNAKTISELQLVDTPDVEGNTIAETAIESGRIRFFAENNGIQQHVRRTLAHEWAHTTERSQGGIRSAYDAAAKMYDFKGREYAGTNVHEDWAVHFAEMLMDPDPELFVTLVHKSPMRAVLLGEALARELNASPEHTSINKQELETRLQYIEENALPEAKQQVMNKLRSSDVSNVSDAASFLSRLLLSHDHADNALAHKLVDTQTVAVGIDRGFDALNENFDTIIAARLLQRMELLQQVDPEMASSRLDRATDVTARMRARMTRSLASGEPEVVEAALATGEQLSRGMADSVVFRRTFPFESLAEVAKNSTDPSLADTSFKLAREAFAAPRVDELALEMLKNGSTARGAAAEYALARNDTKLIGEVTTELSRQVLSGNSSSMTPDALRALNKSLDASVADITAGKNTNVEQALRAVARGRLLQDVVMIRFHVVDPVLQLRVQRITQLERTVRSLLEAKRNGSEADKNEVERALGLVPAGMMDGAQNSSGIVLF